MYRATVFQVAIRATSGAFASRACRFSGGDTSNKRSVCESSLPLFRWRYEQQAEHLRVEPAAFQAAMQENGASESVQFGKSGFTGGKHES